MAKVKTGEKPDPLTEFAQSEVEMQPKIRKPRKQKRHKRNHHEIIRETKTTDSAQVEQASVKVESETKPDAPIVVAPGPLGKSKTKEKKPGFLCKIWAAIRGTSSVAPASYVSAYVTDDHTINDGLIPVEISKLPVGAPKVLYENQWIFLLHENRDGSYSPWEMLDVENSLETELPPEQLGMATEWATAQNYYSHGDSKSSNLHIGLIIAIIVMSVVAAIVIFAVGMD